MNELEYFLKKHGYDEIETQAKDSSLTNRCLISFFLCALCDLIVSFDSYAMVHDWFWTQMLSGLIAQCISLGASLLFFESKTRKERILISISSALGYSSGSSIMLAWLKPWFKIVFEIQ
jgi:hypothetical protein